METDFDTTHLSGQSVLPGFQAILDCEASSLKKVEHERFCLKFVEHGGDSAKAWQDAINPLCDRLQAQKNAHKYLKIEEIRRRIAEISAVFRNRSINEVLAFNLRALNFSPGDLYDPAGRMIALKDLPPGTGVEAKIVDGCLRYVPVFPSPEKARDSIAKIMGIEKQMVELTGKDGGPVETTFVVDDMSRLTSLKERAQALKDAGIIS